MTNVCAPHVRIDHAAGCDIKIISAYNLGKETYYAIFLLIMATAISIQGLKYYEFASIYFLTMMVMDILYYNIFELSERYEFYSTHWGICLTWIAIAILILCAQHAFSKYKLFSEPWIMLLIALINFSCFVTTYFIIITGI
jgi:hypothetical protein